MGVTRSADLRGRVIGAVEGCMSHQDAAAQFGVGMSTVTTWPRTWRGEGRAAAKPKGGDTRSCWVETYHGAIMAAVAAQPDATLADLAAMLEQELGGHFAPSTAHRFPARYRITFKDAHVSSL